MTTVANASSATLDARSVKGYGKILVTSSGRTALHAQRWTPPAGALHRFLRHRLARPYRRRQDIKAGPGVNPSLVSSFKRSDGVRQVLYNKHALYTFEQDTGPGMLSGQGVDNLRRCLVGGLP